MTDRDILGRYSEERKKVECWTRVMGYFRPVVSYNTGKKAEFAERKWFTEDKIHAKRV